MTNLTTTLGLKKGTASDNAETYLETDLGGSLDTLDGLFHPSTGHTHTGAGTNGPRLGALVASQATGDLVYASGAGALARLGIGAARQVLAVNAGATAPEWVNGFTKISELSGASASYDFTSIPQTFRHLLLVLYARSSVAAISEDLALRFNATSTNTYYSQRQSAAATTVAASESLGANYGRAGVLPGASASATFAAAVEILIPHYTQTGKEKVALCRFVAPTGLTSGTLILGQDYVHWDSAAAISNVTLLPVSGSFVANSVASLYGLPL